jgi:hypothetical protein
MNTLPKEAAEELKKAATVPTDKDPNARAKAIDRTIERLRLMYPTHFQEDRDENSRRE